MTNPKAGEPRVTAHDRIVADLGRRVVGGTYLVGATIPREEELATELGVGRSVVREALRVLAAKGLVEPRQRRGTQVLPVSRWHSLDPHVLEWRTESGSSAALLSDLVDLRRMIEPAACELAATRATESELSLIGSLARELRLSERDEEMFITADLRFHHALIQAAHNDLLLHVTGAIEAALRLSREVTVHRAGLHRIEQHEEIARAVLSRQSGRARRSMTHLIDLNAADISSVLDRAPLAHSVPTYEIPR